MTFSSSTQSLASNSAANPPLGKLLVSRKDAAAALSISLRSLDYAIQAGQIGTKVIGRRVLIAAHELARFAGNPTIQ